MGEIMQKKMIISIIAIFISLSLMLSNTYAALIDNEDGTIIDTHTNLMWLKDADGMSYVTWYDAALWIDGLNSTTFLGYDDWRLPLADTNCIGTCPNGELGHLFHIEGIDRDQDHWGPFTNVKACYWTGSEVDAFQVWIQMFTPSGFQVPDYMDYPVCAVWAVRESGALFYYCDDDNDGYFDSSIDGNCVGVSCQPQGCQTAPGNDCDDTNSSVHPGATEFCNCIDDNCNGSIDEDGVCSLTISSINKALSCGPTCTDADGDTYATQGGACGPVDCNDINAAVHPGATEVCDDIDNNCDGSVDEGLSLSSWYRDNDGDGYGNPSIWQYKCHQPAGGWVANNTDCNDNDQNIYPGGPEVRIVSPLAYYSIYQLQTAYNNTGNGATIQGKMVTYTGNLTIEQNKAVTMTGGYDCSYSTIIGRTTLNGNMTISNGIITMGNFILQ